MSTRQIFLSHSSADGALATLLANEIEQELGDGFRVFASTRADAIDNGHKWFDVILKRMDEADALVVLITESGKNSAWVGFELGYFWRKDSIYPLHHPRVPLPAPFSALQSKKIIVREELNNFFDALCDKLSVKRSGKADLDAIIQTAQNIIITPVGDKSLGKFIEYLENSRWNYIERSISMNTTLECWVCQDMIDYTIEGYYIPRGDSLKGVLGSKVNNYSLLDAKLMIEGKVVYSLKLTTFTLPSGDFWLTIPKLNSSNEWCWLKNSLEISVTRAIGVFNGKRPSTPEEFDCELEKTARELGIVIVE